MTKRRPIFEFKGLSGFLGSSSSDSSSYYYRHRYTDETPLDPYFRHSRNRSSRRHRPSSSSPRRHHRHHSRSHKHHKHGHTRTKHYSRRAHFEADQRHRRREFDDQIEDQFRASEARAAALAAHGIDHDSLDESLRRAHLARRRTRTRGSVASPSLKARSAAGHSRASRSRGSYLDPEARDLRSPPPLDPTSRDPDDSSHHDYPPGTHLSPEDRRPRNGDVQFVDGYPDEYDIAARAVDPDLEHSFNPTGLPQEDSDEEDDSEHRVYRDNEYASKARERRGHGTGRHRKRRKSKKQGKRRKRRSSHKRRKEREQKQDDFEEEDERQAGSDAGETGFDEFGNPIEQSAREEETVQPGMKSDRDAEEEGREDGDKKKRNILRVVTVALGALVVGLIVKRILGKRKKKKEEEEAAAAEAQQAIDGPFGGEGGQLLAGPNPLQLSLPEASFSVKVPQNETFIVERGGKYSRRLNPGSNMLIPCVDRIAFRFSLKEVSMAVPQQQCYTRENISVKANALLFAKIEDAVGAAYGVDDVYRSLMLLAQTVMRKEIGRLSLDQTFQDRDGLNARILSLMNDASRPWGVGCTRFELRDIILPEELRAALERDAQMQRQVQSDVFASQAQRDAMINRAEGEMQAQMRISQARQIEVVNQAIGEAHAISERGEAIAGAMRDVAEVVNEPGGEKALQMRIAEQYINAYGNAARVNGQVPGPQDPGNVAHAMNNAIGLLNSLGQPNSSVSNPYVIPETNPYTMPQAVEAGHPKLTHEGQGGNNQSYVPSSAPHQLPHGTPQTHQSTPQMQSGIPPAPQGSAQHRAEDLPYMPERLVPTSLGPAHAPASTASTTSPATRTEPRPQSYAGPSYPQAPMASPQTKP